MALLIYNNSALTWLNGSIQFSREGIPITVGFYKLINGQITKEPSYNICLNQKYVLRVNIPDIDSEGAWYLSETSNGNYEAIPSENGSTTFQILQRAPVMLNRVFIGSFGSVRGRIALNSVSEDQWKSVGYTKPLPVLLNNCTECGCLAGQRCSDVGICRDTAGPCPKNVPCGFAGGRCPGGCPDITTSCQNVNGFYTCTPNQKKNFWISFWIIMALLVVLLIIGIFIGYNNRDIDRMRQEQYAALVENGYT